jgi:hypothetical protein
MTMWSIEVFEAMLAENEYEKQGAIRMLWNADSAICD